MGIFAKVNNQGMSDEDAFEELCCQLFETRGRHHEGHGDGWTNRTMTTTFTDKMRNIGNVPIWYANAQGVATDLARMRIPGLDECIERSWHITCADDVACN